jgi:hypothetical protein
MHAYFSKCFYACRIPLGRCTMHVSNCDFFEHDVSKCALEQMLAPIKMPVVRMQPLGDQIVTMTS